MSRQTTHPNRRSRQERALTQRQWEFKRYSNMNELPLDGTLRKLTTVEDKANKASQDVTALKKKLGVKDEA